MQVGKLCFPNEAKLRNWKKITKCSSVRLFDNQYEFLLPSHKADHFFEGNHIIVKNQHFCNLSPVLIFHRYIASHNSLFPLSSPLWLTSTGNVPTHDFFIARLHHYFKRDVGSQSMRADGATSLAEHGVPPSLMQLMGHWSSQAFLIYIQKNPVLIQALLYSSHTP